MNYDKLSPAQARMAKKFSEASDMTVSQAVKYLNECFQLAKGEITESDFEYKTGWSAHTIRF
jgi:hypothetical protein